MNHPGNCSTLEWIVDQYSVSTDARSGILNDPNREDAPEYIVRLIGQVVTVSVETVKLVGRLKVLLCHPRTLQKLYRRGHRGFAEETS